jgi:hypothetical protein
MVHCQFQDYPFGLSENPGLSKKNATRMLRHCTTSQKIAGLIPDDIIGIFH